MSASGAGVCAVGSGSGPTTMANRTTRLVIRVQDLSELPTGGWHAVKGRPHAPCPPPAANRNARRIQLTTHVVNCLVTKTGSQVYGAGRISLDTRHLSLDTRPVSIDHRPFPIDFYMLPRTLEPEVMDTAEEAADYD